MISATYSPEDNKIRLYSTSRLGAETYARVKDAGFKWAPKQELFVAPKWTPEREDLAIELAGEIEPEEMTLAERAQIKADRLDGIADKRARQSNAFQRTANELSEAFYMGQPILVGHHSERKARKTQERMQSAMNKAVEASKAVNYWLYRAEGVEAFANMKNDPRVRAGRIKTLLAELRDVQRDINHANLCLKVWAKITTDEAIEKAINCGAIATGQLAPWNTSTRMKENNWTFQEARAKCIEGAEKVVRSERLQRWINHILNRLSYERELLGDVPRFEGTITPVILQAFARDNGAFKPEAKLIEGESFQLSSAVALPLQIADGSYIEMLADDWRDLMQSVGYQVPDQKERRKSSKPAPAPLVNPTAEQAEQLQRIWNLQMVAACKANQEPKENVVTSMLQAKFSAYSKGEYANFKTVEIDAEGRRIGGVWRGGEYVQSAEPVARIRVSTYGSDYYKPGSVIQITDKAAKALPIDLDAIEKAARAAIETKEVAA